MKEEDDKKRRERTKKMEEWLGIYITSLLGLGKGEKRQGYLMN